MCHAAPARPEGARGRPPSGDNFSGAARSKPVGAAFEQRARQFLERHGLGFVAANVTMRGGELDLVMREPDGMLVFVEVRARRSTRHGAGAACRFDVVAFEAGRLAWLRDAFRTDDA
ncbi:MULTISPECIES: YraN family protein [Burkholderia cepacia complex]|uniref:YraN family protein n=1 Tax=Burkholderia cepacia complex TaxID=87882 RepID=UPI00006D9D67|nr:YraN family protein [Burkholderia cenocepacia]HEM7884866.1 YraN family protein [Burkholderia cenocepacia]